MVNAVRPDSIVIKSTFFLKLVKMKNAGSDVEKHVIRQEIAFTYSWHTQAISRIDFCITFSSFDANLMHSSLDSQSAI